jgi:hypothetical protein
MHDLQASAESCNLGTVKALHMRGMNPSTVSHTPSNLLPTSHPPVQLLVRFLGKAAQGTRVCCDVRVESL